LLCYVGHHDKAYDWAQRRKLETHPKTGAAQLVEIRETVKEIVVPVPVYVQTEPDAVPEQTAERKALFAEMSDDELLGYGVPAEWLNDVKKATEDSLLIVADHLPAEASEARNSAPVLGDTPLRATSTPSGLTRSPKLSGHRVDTYHAQIHHWPAKPGAATRLSSSPMPEAGLPRAPAQFR
jgi:hypothetical protein